MNQRLQLAACLTALSAAFSSPAFALKYAEPEHNLKADPTLPSCSLGR